MSFLLDQNLAITLTCYDDTLTKTNDFIVGSAYIKSFFYKKTRFGVEGKFVFYESHTDDQGEVDVEQAYLLNASLIKIEASVNNTLSLNSDEDTEEKYTFSCCGYSQFIPAIRYSVRYENINNKEITIEFKDPLAVLASQFSCFDLFVDTSYQDVFQSYFDLLDKDKVFIDFTIDSSVQSLTEKKSLITVGCSYYDKDKKNTFYDYLIYILKYYQLELVYDGAAAYTVTSQLQPQDYQWDLTDYFSMSDIQFYAYSPPSYASRLCLPFFNGTADQSKELAVKVLPHLHTDVDSATELLNQADQQQQSALYRVDMDLKYITGLHQALNKSADLTIQTSTDDNVKVYSPDILVDKELKVLEFSCEFSQEIDLSRIGWFKQEMAKSSHTFFKMCSSVKLIDQATLCIEYPMTAMIEYPIYGQGVIKEAEAKDQYKYTIADFDNALKAGRLDYQVEVLYSVDDNNQPLVITASQMKQPYDQFFYPYANQATVNLKLHMESALIESAALHSVDSSLLNQDEQTNLINMGNDRSSYMKLSNKDDTNQLELTNANDSIRQSIKLTDEGMSFVFTSSGDEGE
ncbi:hypothetical protein Psal006b_01433 [Piscirickettsia salmonis]|uniref:Coproporphyrinogen III oxidase n=1 Tax=Piscirickettsia salmonis TaxID=1238 RepID=A0A1L6TC62_PISSA|nr:hypothetical protein [Piscirickettsia salmonis]AKP74085.1 hypothetical protein PSLF89_2399 [Piscirickettsia salmonis LF-89 = ATCC VR-1361]ALB22956.1 coproporphyrinogen III oxidase [Piscirickettsia salmonis]ALY02906.1 hypothetical protein AWE47_08680 [Piscirickettsia salmonis]AMA42462.1 hypothetical protein AWJ11_08895 [Piscirickettsia salmonis]AOS34932.1 hypothetical protein AVM72_06035 [Piscirickettsia salmonis]